MKSAQAAPPPPAHTTTEDIIGRARRVRAKRLTAMGGGAVACLAIAATAVVQFSPRGGADGLAPAAAPSAPVASFSAPPAKPATPPLPVKKVRFTTTLGTYQVGRYTVGPAGQVTDGYTELPVYDGETWPDDNGTTYPYAGATITVYDKDVYDPSTFGGAGDATLVIGDEYRLRVDGREAIGRDWTFAQPGDESKKWVRSALAWQYADNAWATLVPNYGHTDITRAEVAQIAAKLSTGSKRELKVPYTFGYLPQGWQAVAVAQNDASTGLPGSKVFLQQGAVADPATRIDEILPGHLAITVSKGESKISSIRGRDGVHCFEGNRSCTIVKGDYLVDVNNYGETLTDAQVRQITEGLRLTDLADQSSWKPVTV